MRRRDLADRLAVTRGQHVGHPSRRSTTAADRIQAAGHGPHHLVAERFAGDLDHNETRSWHGWHRHVSLVMLAFAGIMLLVGTVVIRRMVKIRY